MIMIYLYIVHTTILLHAMQLLTRDDTIFYHFKYINLVGTNYNFYSNIRFLRYAEFNKNGKN